MSFVENMPGHLVRRFHQASVSIFHQQVDATGYDITPVQFAALDRMARAPGIDQITLAGLIGCDRTTMAGVVARLAKKNWITRETNPDDRRSKSLFLSSQGAQMLTAVSPSIERAQEAMLAALTESERVVFLTLLKKATEELSDSFGAG